MDARLAFALAFAAVSAEILLASRLAPALRGLTLGALMLVPIAGAWFLNGVAPTPFNAALLTLVLLVGCTAPGAALGARIERPGHLLAVAVISALADLWSVFDKHGPTAQMLEKATAAPDRMALFALPWPLLGTGTIQPIIGAGDVLFAALYLASFERHGLSVKRALLGLAAGFGAGLGALLLLERAVPLLPLLGAGVVLADRRVRELEQRELRAMVAVVLGLLGLMGARLWG
jgi:hypothetical protein